MPLYLVGPYLVVLGIAQDGGHPQLGCFKACCESARNGNQQSLVCCLGLVDPHTRHMWIFDATPNLPEQIHGLNALNGTNKIVDGIFLSHGHIGHYTGLMYLGREVMATHNVPVYCMPRMMEFLSKNGPWSLLIQNQNILLKELKDNTIVSLAENITVQVFEVPHRGEFTETIGFKIIGPKKKVLFIPDIDKWHQWKTNIIDAVKSVDFAFIDGTFYQNGEVPGRNMNEIPHPFVEESLSLFEPSLTQEQKSGIYFIHLNHTNKLLQQDSPEYQSLVKKGYNVAQEKLKIFI